LAVVWASSSCCCCCCCCCCSFFLRTLHCELAIPTAKVLTFSSRRSCSQVCSPQGLAQECSAAPPSLALRLRHLA
jgi:hypothetical protein